MCIRDRPPADPPRTVNRTVTCPDTVCSAGSKAKAEASAASARDSARIWRPPPKPPSKSDTSTSSATVDGAATAAVLERHHLRAACSLGLSFDTDISSEETSKVAAGEKLLHAALEVTDALGSRYLTGVILSLIHI